MGGSPMDRKVLGLILVAANQIQHTLQSSEVKGRGLLGRGPKELEKGWATVMYNC